MDDVKNFKEEIMSNSDSTIQKSKAPTENLYTQAEVDEIVRQRLEEVQTSPELSPEKQRAAELDARELNMQKREYLLERVQRWGLDNLSTQMKGMLLHTAYDTFKEEAKTLCGIWEANEMDSFTKSVDAMFDMLAQARSEGYDEGLKDGAEEATTTHHVKEESDIMNEIFKKGGHFN